MIPENLVEALCRRHGLPTSVGTRLVPLVRRALHSPDAIRDRILALVDRNLAKIAAGQATEDSIWLDIDKEVLISVARVLHGWSPSDQMLDFNSLSTPKRVEGDEAA